MPTTRSMNCGLRRKREPIASNEAPSSRQRMIRRSSGRSPDSRRAIVSRGRRASTETRSMNSGLRRKRAATSRGSVPASSQARTRRSSGRFAVGSTLAPYGVGRRRAPRPDRRQGEATSPPVSGSSRVWLKHTKQDHFCTPYTWSATLRVVVEPQWTQVRSISRPYRRRPGTGRGAPPGRQISTWAPTSKIRSGGSPKNRAALSAPRCRRAYSRSRGTGMPSRDSEARTDSRPTK